MIEVERDGDGQIEGRKDIDDEETQLCRGQSLVLILPARDVHSTTTSHAKTF